MRLRQDDEPGRKSRPQAQGIGRLGLAVADRLDAPTDVLGDEGGCIDRKSQQNGHELGQDNHAAEKVEALKLGHRKGHVESANEANQNRQADNQRQPRPEAWELLARQLLTSVRPAHHEDRPDDPEHQR
jgi:hypothetical protein